MTWREYQKRLPVEGEVRRWFGLWPDANIAIVTGGLSGVVVVDCDNDDVIAYAKTVGLSSPFSVQTRRGRHFYFRYPSGSSVRNRAKMHGMTGFDLRGEGGYAILPPSVRSDGSIYRWDAVVLDWEDCPIYPGETNVVRLDGSPWDGEGPLDLASAVARHPDESLSVWQRAQAQAAREGGKIKPGNRNELLRDCASEAILEGMFGENLRIKCKAFTDFFFSDELPAEEFEATIASMEDAERRNHPDRFDEHGVYIYRKVGGSARKFRLFLPSQSRDLKTQIELKGLLVDPIIRPGSFSMVYGYTGHGKSLFVEGLLWAGAQGLPFGPFETRRPFRTLYFDWENGAHTIADRSEMFTRMFGDTDDRFAIWAPSIMNEDLDLRESSHLRMMQDIIGDYKPDVTVFDTIRSAWPGLEENMAPAWAPVNRCAMALRNAGYAVIYLHHSNKPTEEGLGREAGSTAQLMNVETQVRVTQLFDNEEVAKAKAGKYDPRVYRLVAGRLEPDSRVNMIMEISMGKVRDWSYNHVQSSWVALCERFADGTMYVLSSVSKKQWAAKAAMSGMSIEDISAKLSVPKIAIKRWLHAG